MDKNFIKNITVFIILNIVAYYLHQYFINSTIQEKSAGVVNVKISYIINAIASLFMCVSVFSLKKKFEEHIGFIFLGLSVVKMILLFLMLNPTNESGTVTKIDAFAFFIPFGVNLVLEQIYIVKMLRISDLVKELKDK